jgi:predicted nucleic acid-binding protein
MNNLIDSSVWIEYFRGNPDYLFINDLINVNAVSTNDIILTELLPSIMHKKEYELANLLSSMKNYPLVIDWQEIRNIQLLNLKHGNNKTGISDIIIVQNCIQNKLKLVAHDKHFKLMAEYIPLELFR